MAGGRRRRTRLCFLFDQLASASAPCYVNVHDRNQFLATDVKFE